uniref:Uncharacterized protein n=1 Tax=Chenopodium quinoa TaxID=63459 RepID=A0A803N2S8_CHEQI
MDDTPNNKKKAANKKSKDDKESDKLAKDKVVAEVAMKMKITMEQLEGKEKKLVLRKRRGPMEEPYFKVREKNEVGIPQSRAIDIMPIDVHLVYGIPIGGKVIVKSNDEDEVQVEAVRKLIMVV